MQINYTTATAANIVCGEFPLFVPAHKTTSESLWRVPPHQRCYVWTLSTQTKLIDTLINGYPIPAIVLVQRLTLSPSGAPIMRWEIEDGQQRLTTMYRFVNNEFKINIDNENLYYDELSETLRTRLLNFQVPLIQLVFDPSTSEDDQDSIITDIFVRLQAGTPLSDGDKYHASSKSPVIQNFTIFYDEFNASIIRYIGKIGSTKTRTGLSDICGAIMTLSLQNPHLLRRSFKENYPHLNEPFTHAENIPRFFRTYFELLDRIVPNGKIPKIYGKISTFLGYSVIEYITHQIDESRESFPSPQLEWYLKRLVNDREYMPTTFASLSSANRRNNGPESITARLSAIKAAYKQEHTDCTESDGESD